MRTISLMVLSVLLLLGGLGAQDVPMALQVKLVLKVTSMDTNFARFGNPVPIGVSSDEALAAFTAVQSAIQMKGVPYTVEKMAAPGDVGRYKVVFVDKNWQSQYQAATQVAQANGVLCFGSEEAFVAAGGGGLAFKLVGTAPKIVANMGNLKAMGSEFPATAAKLFETVGN